MHDDKKVQAIFRKVISAGHYGKVEGYMCHALNHAQILGTIEWSEWHTARRAIDGYLSHLRPGCSVLHVALESGLGTPEASTRWQDVYAWADFFGREIYWNWEKRPKRGSDVPKSEFNNRAKSEFNNRAKSEFRLSQEINDDRNS